MLSSLLSFGLLPVGYTTAGVLITVMCFINEFVGSYTLRNLILYGKLTCQVTEASDNSKRLPQWLFFPKRWFSHFYIVSLLCLGFWIFYMQGVHTRLFAVEPRLVVKMKHLTNEHRVASVPWSTAQMALILLFLHSFRRAYETLFVSVFSNSTINLLHYGLGIAFYFFLPLSILCETKGMVTSDTVYFSLSSLSGEQWLAMALFLACNYAQHTIAIQMGDLRKSLSGTIRHYGHGIIYNGLFDYVSSPHYLLEICIYASMTLFVWQCFAFKFVLLFVVMNQTCAAVINHKWYVATFRDKYPKNRKAIIPYLF